MHMVSCETLTSVQLQDQPKPRPSFQPNYSLIAHLPDNKLIITFTCKFISSFRNLFVALFRPPASEMRQSEEVLLSNALFGYFSRAAH